MSLFKLSWVDIIVNIPAIVARTFIFLEVLFNFWLSTISLCYCDCCLPEAGFYIFILFGLWVPRQRPTHSAGIISETGVQQWTVPVNTLPYLTFVILIVGMLIVVWATISLIATPLYLHQLHVYYSSIFLSMYTTISNVYSESHLLITPFPVYQSQKSFPISHSSLAIIEIFNTSTHVVLA